MSTAIKQTSSYPLQTKEANSLQVYEQDEPKLLQQFYITLESNLTQISLTNKEAHPDIMQKLKDLLAADASWKNAYKIEQLLVEVYDEVSLKLEIERRLLEIDYSLSPEQASFYKEKLPKQDSIPKLRAYLGRLLNDLQWRYTVREGQQLYLRDCRKRTSWLLIGSIIMFLSAVILMQYGRQQFKEIVVIAITISAGFMGACFSLITGLKDLETKSFNDLKTVHQMSYLLSRAVIGVGAALILYYFVTSNIVSGDVFPKIVDGEPELYKLIVWGFIAGFSEKLIPSLMSKTEKSIQPEHASSNQPASTKVALTAPEQKSDVTE